MHVADVEEYLDMLVKSLKAKEKMVPKEKQRGNIWLSDFVTDIFLIGLLLANLDWLINGVPNYILLNLSTLEWSVIFTINIITIIIYFLATPVRPK